MAFRFKNTFERKLTTYDNPYQYINEKGELKNDAEKKSLAMATQFSGKNLQGTKWNRYGKRPEGFGSTLDSEIMNREITKERENWGDGYVSFQMLDANGGVAANKPLNLGGRMFYGDDKGKFTVVDEAFLEKMVQIENEKRDYLKSLVKKASVSDDVCSLMLGVQDCVTLLGPNTDGGGLFPNRGPTKDLYEVDARPSAIETYDDNSITYSRACQKFRSVLKLRMPIVSELTNKKAENAD